MQPKFAKPLQQGDTIALVAPAGPLNRERIERAIGYYEERGFRIKTYRDIYTVDGYLAGDDEAKIDELQQAFADPEVSAVFPARGGTGVTRILHRLDYDVIARNPKLFTGFSDITALHAAILAKTGLVTFHSPNPMDGPGHADGFTTFTEQHYWRALFAEEYSHSETKQWQVPLRDADKEGIVTYHPGKATGRLVGGNLALICSVLGTPYEANLQDNILLLEDIGEPPYRVDRFLSQLRLAGQLDAVAGIVLGQFTDCVPEEEAMSLSLKRVFEDYLGPLGVPILQNFPVGHERDNATLPLGVQVELNADDRQLTVLECPVQC